MKKVNANDYYIQYLKSSFDKSLQTEAKNGESDPKDKIQKALKKTFEKSEQKFYILV